MTNTRRLEPASGSTLGATAHGFRLAELDDAGLEQVRRGVADHGVVVFSGQGLTRDQHVALAERFGSIDEYDTRVPNATANPYVARPQGTAVVAEMSNFDANGERVARPDDGTWRSDGSSKSPPVTFSIRTAERVDGDALTTQFADMAAACEALAGDLDAAVASADVWHSAVYVKALAGAVPVPVPEDPTTLPGAWHRLVRRHPQTGRDALFLSDHACHLSGMGAAEAARTIRSLLAEACQPPRVFTHAWTAGDTAIWDLRRVVHRTATWDTSGPALLRHISVLCSEAAGR